MKIFKTTEFFDNGVHTKKYYFCGIRYLKKIWSNLSQETHLFKFKISKKIVLSEQKIELRNDGISIIGLGDISGEGKTGKAAVQSLLKSDINFDNGTFNDIYRGYIPGFKKQLVFSTSNFYKNPGYDIIPLLVWEFESGMPPVRPWAFKDIYAIATFSTFCAKYFKKIAPQDMKITVLPYPVDIDLTKLEPQKTVRAKYSIKPRDFVFFFNFSYTSSYFRKNPEGTLAAFALAFPKHENNIKLVIKTICANSAPNMVARLNAKIQELGLENNIILINQDLTDGEQYSLINCCDVYVSLHRGEGLGLGMMEAMYMAKPVIATNYGGNTDFTTPDTALMVDYKMVKPQEIDIDAYKYVEKWPEPNIKTAARHMRALYNNPKLRKQIGTAGQNFIKQNFNSNRFNKTVKSFL